MEDKTSDYSDIFVTEDNTFDVTVKYYKENNGLIVEGVDDSFNNDKKPKQFVVTMKYPAQSDVAMIYKQGATFKTSSADDIDIRNILELEFSRFLCLMRKWTLADKLELASVMKLNPKIIRSIIVQIRSIIGMDGII